MFYLCRNYGNIKEYNNTFIKLFRKKQNKVMDKEQSDKEIVYSKNVIEFLTVANEFCLFVEKADNYTKEDIIQYMLKICPLIYLKGALLPEAKESDFEIPERYVSEEDWDAIYKTINAKLGKDDIYWIISNNEAGEYTPSMASIADNLADIYQDMKDIMMLYQKVTHAAKENSVAECRLLFESHWGIRLINAHKALHNVAFPEIKAEEFYENDN